MDMDRRTFLKYAGAVATWAGISVVVHACSGGGDPAAPGGQGDVAGSISANHGHSVVITAAQITAAGAVVLTLTGAAHTHTVSLTAPQVGDIGAGTQVSVTSTNDNAHTHQVTFN